MDSTREQLTQLIADPAAFLDRCRPDPAQDGSHQPQRARPRPRLGVVSALATEDDPAVRTAAVEKLGVVGPPAFALIDKARFDAESTVREAAATAYGEIGDAASPRMARQAASEDPDRGVREAAVAAMGAIGDPGGGCLLLLVSEGPPQVRRRAVAAITVFDDPRVEPALQRAALDRNPGVREAAEMVVGRQLG